VPAPIMPTTHVPHVTEIPTSSPFRKKK